MTPAQIIHHRRLRVLDHAAQNGNVSATCRTFGISRKTFYAWRSLAERYGTDALLPKDRRPPAMPNATPTHVVEELLTLAVQSPTLGCRRLADRLEERGLSIGKTAVQDLLVRSGLGTRARRVARAAAITALVGGPVTEAAASDELLGFCHWAARPGDLVALDTFYIGNLKGVGKVHQLTAIDHATRMAVVLVVWCGVDGEVAARFARQVVERFARFGVEVRAVLTDNGPEYIASGFRARLATLGLDHHRTPPRSPNHNAVVERFQGTVLQECWRPAFHRRRFDSVRQLQAEVDAWLVHYARRRRNHGDFMRGRTPLEVLEIHRNREAA